MYLVEHSKEINMEQHVTLDGIEYDANTFTPEQTHLLDHCVDLDRQIRTNQFQLQQLQVGKDVFLKMLKTELEK
jgi:hypothetical protein